ncbi:MAG: hypothetical protein KAU31_14475, partial [Spirochaetaceae bacterium]|nr:hypothetical protein [Spirochaetaceae bacterium]
TESLEDAKRILTEQKDELVTLLEALVEKETLTDAEVRDLLDMPERKSATDLSTDDEDSAAGA